MQEINSQEWQQKTTVDSDAFILDVRTNEEVDEGMIPGAKQINISEPATFMEEANKLEKSKNYYIYCRTGVRSAQACAVLESLGFEKTYNLLGGITDWDGPVE